MKYGIIFERDVRLAMKQGWAAPLGFFLLVILSFPLGLTGEAGEAVQNLPQLACGLIWIGLLLAHLLILPRLFEADLADGVMDVLLLEAELPAMMVAAKALAVWAGAALPLVGLVPLAGILFELALADIVPLTVSALIGSFALVFLGGFAAALTGGLRAREWLTPLIVLPLELPVLIFGAQAACVPFDIFFTAPPSLILISLALMAVALSPVATALALKLQET